MEQERIHSIHKSLLQKNSLKSSAVPISMGFAHAQESSQANRAFPAKRQQQNELIF